MGGFWGGVRRCAERRAAARKGLTTSPGERRKVPTIGFRRPAPGSHDETTKNADRQRRAERRHEFNMAFVPWLGRNTMTLIICFAFVVSIAVLASSKNTDKLLTAVGVAGGVVTGTLAVKKIKNLLPKALVDKE